jgi:acyl carrier protein
VDGRAVQPLLRKVVKAKASAAQSKSSALTLDQIKAMPLEARKEALLDYSRRQVITILGLDPSQPFDSDKVLTNLGMDSLMAVELKNKIVGDLSINIDVTYFLEEATAAGLAQKIMDQLGTNGAKPDADEVVDSEKAQQLLSNLDQMSEDEVNALLNDLLTNREGP